MISVIVPVYNEQNNINFFIKTIVPMLEKIGTYEIIFCLDPSSDNSESIIMSEIEKNKNIKLIVFSRRFGQSNCIYAGIKNCKGDACVVIDVDMQDPPELIIQMYEEMQKGYDCVYAQRIKREGENFIRILITNFYYFLINKFNDYKIPKNAGEFRIFSRKIIEQIKDSNDINFFLRGITPLIGFKHKSIKFVRPKRLSGTSKYSLGSFTGAITGIVNFSTLISRSIQFFFILNILILIYNLLNNSGLVIVYLNIVIIFFIFVVFIFEQQLKNINNLIMKRKSYIIDKRINF